MARREHFSAPPRALSPQYKNQNVQRMTAFDHQRIAMERLKMEENARIKNEAELHAELFDFTYVTAVDEYGFPLRTSYEIPDSVSSVYVAPNFEEKTPENQNSVSKEGSPEPSGGTE